ncbi:MAG TPA: peptidylprolyl isomerase [Desulfuromonadales bacterium]|jgi:peptidylprolyl isomerase
MAKVKQGDRVRINFTGRLEDGTIFDTTVEEAGCTSDDCVSDDCGCETGPMELTIGSESFFPQIEAALVGMAPGEKKTIVIPAEDAFGDYDEENVIILGRDQFPDDLVPEVDMDLELNGEDGESIVGTVVEVTDENVTLDANHPLAGEDLHFDLELVEIL